MGLTSTAFDMTLKAQKKEKAYIMMTPLIFPLMQGAPPVGLPNDHMS